MVAAFTLAAATAVSAGDLTPVKKIEQQPFVAATQRLLQALQLAGSPLPQADAEAIQAAIAEVDPEACVTGIQAALDRNCLAEVTINPESRVSAKEGPVRHELIQQGWRAFLVKVINEAGVTAQVRVDSPQAEPVYQTGKGARERPSTDQKLVTSAESAQRFLDIAQFTKQPLKPELSGLNVEYRIVQLYSRDVGPREATLVFDIGQGTQDLGFRSEVPLLFKALPAVEVVLDVKDDDGTPTTASFLIKDSEGRVYPNPSRRLAPDFFFHQQIYRADGESVHLPPGEYTVQVGRGPEYVIQTHTLHVPDLSQSASAGGGAYPASFQLQRWIETKNRGWYSGDHHVHAAGCKHYDSPTEGVGPADMMRHVLGEDLNVGCVLSWGPCWYAQKAHFEGKVHALSKPNYLMRYDVEVSGFPSSHAGHLCLLRLIEDDYPGTSILEDWPSWTMPVLQWGQRQGAVVGYSHSGWGIALPDYAPDGSRIPLGGERNRTPKGGRAADTLPDFAMPAFDGIGANEYVVTVAHGACDFISAVDTPAVWELNVWYHTNNCGYRAKISGETDFPCIYGERVGLGRIYVKLEDQQLDYDAWVQGVKLGRSYCCDGLGHLLDFKVASATDSSQSVAVGEPGPGGEISELKLPKAGKVTVTCDVAALLAESPTPETEAIRHKRLDQQPYWHIERARIGDTRTVPVELIVNGYPVAKQEIAADGSVQALSFDVDLPISSWVAVRIFPSVHTNPVYVLVEDQPIRASKRSADWCATAVETCWNSKRNQIREAERADAQQAYDAAAATYRKIRDESVAE
ncbi:MAG: CehA/McbA family metallohydrolase [Planctomycetaceae bacterium]|nr:CehA/McbA family metallohydrolase [Planctomycetaceae bacterium]